MNTRMPFRFPFRAGFFVGRQSLTAFLIVMGTALLATAPAHAAQTFGHPVPGRHVYDQAALLTAVETADLEARARAVAAAGAPVVVFLRAHSADQAQTQADAQALMNAWAVESKTGARDGLVIFLNLKPGDLRHGQAALYAGQTHVSGGRLPQYELQRIYTNVMRPLLASGQTAAGIGAGAGLDAAARDLAYGPPPAPTPGPLQRTAGDLARLPFNALAVLGAAGLAALTARAWRSRPIPVRAGAATTLPPGDLAPAMAGALVVGRVSDAQMEATILDLARRGALTLEAGGPKQVTIRLLDHTQLREPFEESMWRSLAGAAGPDGTVDHKDMAKVRARWGLSKGVLRDALRARGWYDPAAGTRRTPLYTAGLVALIGAAVGFILVGIAQEGWGALGAGILVVAGITALCLGYALPETAPEGERVAVPWRAYLAGLKAASRDASRDLDLDSALPYAVALGTATALHTRLKVASAQGYAPAWFRGGGTAGFYPYWAAFPASAASSGNAGNGEGGAASGGAGAGGSF